MYGRNMTSQVLSEQLSTVPVQAFVRLLQGRTAATRVLAPISCGTRADDQLLRGLLRLAPTIDG